MPKLRNGLIPKVALSPAKSTRDQVQSVQAARGRIAVKAAEPLKAAVQLLPYQRRWVDDNSPLKIAVKGRQTGYSFSATFRAALRCLEQRTTWVFLSKGERQARLLMEKVQEHIQACGLASQLNVSQFFEGTLIKQLEIRFPNGSVIYGLPANPDTARGYSGNVSLDEFAFHADAEKIYTALYPIITRGYGLEVISTPNGQQGKFFELAKAAGLVEKPQSLKTTDSVLPGSAPATQNLKSKIQNRQAWSGHWCDIYLAVREGLKVNLELLRTGVDDETWRQEFCCEFISSASEWITAELFQSCVSSEATTDFGFSILDFGLKGRTESVIQNPKSQIQNLYAGWDIARNRDLSVIWLSELVGDVTWTRGVIEMRDMSTPDQLREAASLMPYIRRMNIDQSGMGLSIVETLEEEFPGKVEGVQFTQQTKEALAVLAKRRMEEMRVRIPDDENIRASFRAVKKTQNSIGQFRFDAEHDIRYGHADHWWAFCLAETAAEKPTYHLTDVGMLIGKPLVAGMAEAIL
jgi:phage FluMu gp28-like protein